MLLYQTVPSFFLSAAESR